jgi:ATP-dependent DNA helicase RecG
VHPAALGVADLEVGELAHVGTPQVTPQVSWLLEVLIGDMSRSELMSALALKDRMHFANDYLRPALEVDLIHYTIPDKPNSRLRQYRLTEKGRAVLALLERTG